MAEKYELAYADYKAGMKQKDIATKYDVTVNTVKSWQQRKWKKLESEGAEEKVCTPEKSMHTENKGAEVENSVSKQDEIDEFGMTPKQRKFADCYIKSGNATQAAIRAGYSEKTARSQGQRLLTNVDIKKYVDARLEEISSNDIADATEVMKYLTRVMRREEKESVPMTISKEESKYIDGKKRTVKVQEIEVVEIPSHLSDSNKAAELLGKRFRLFTDTDDEMRAIKVENAKLANERAAVEIERTRIAIAKETGTADEYEDDGFLDALKGVKVDWSDD